MLDFFKSIPEEVATPRFRINLGFRGSSRLTYPLMALLGVAVACGGQPVKTDSKVEGVATVVIVAPGITTNLWDRKQDFVWTPPGRPTVIIPHNDQVESRSQKTPECEKEIKVPDSYLPATPVVPTPGSRLGRVERAVGQRADRALDSLDAPKAQLYFCSVTPAHH